VTPLLAAIPAPPIQGFQLGPLDLRLYGILIAFGAYLALRWTVSRYAASGGDPELAERAGLGALLFGFLGARLGYVLPRLDRFIDRPLEILAIWQGGLALFGGLLAGTLAVIVIVRRGRGDLAGMADAIAAGLPLAQAIGRWGNYFNQELYGRPTDLPWALEVEPAFRRPGYGDAPTFHPTFLYESLWNLALVGLIVRLGRRGTLPRGALILVYAVGYGTGRFLVELLRIDTVERYAGLSRNNWIALLLILGGSIALLRLRARPQERSDPGAAAAGPVGSHAPGAAEVPSEGSPEGPSDLPEATDHN